MANIRVYSRSNVTGSPSLWRPSPKTYQPKEVQINTLKNICDGVNDFKTTYVSKKIWVAETGTWSAPLYVACNYVE